MSAEITTQRSIEYTSNLRLLSQQMGSKLRGTVMVGNHRGKQAVPVDQIGSVDVYDVVGRRSNNTYVDTPHRRRWVFPQRRAVHDTVDIADEVENLANPGSLYAQAQAAAMGRKMDRVILQALSGTSTTGETGASTESFAAGNKFGTGTAMSLAKLTNAVKLIREQTKVFGETIYCALAARTIDAMLNITGITSADYNSVRVLVNGEISTFMGVTFVPTEEVSVLTESADYGALFYTKSGGHLGIWEDINGKVDVLPEMEHTTQISTYANFGATRIEQARVVWLQHT